MGFEGEYDLYDSSEDIAEQVASGLISRRNLARAVLATEIVFVSNLVGSGHDWAITTGRGDVETLELLRSLQGRLTGETRGVIGAGIGTRVPRRL